MTHATEQERAEFELMRTAYEKAFGPPPIGAVWSDFGYAIKTHQASEARAYTERFKGFIAGWVARRAPAAPVPQAVTGLLTIDEYREKYRQIYVLNDDERYGYECLYEEIVSGIQKLELAAAPQPPEAAPVQMPEPFTTLVRKKSWSTNCYEASPLSTAKEYGRQWADERINVYTEQQVRQLLAQCGIK